MGIFLCWSTSEELSSQNHELWKRLKINSDERKKNDIYVVDDSVKVAVDDIDYCSMIFDVNAVRDREWIGRQDVFMKEKMNRKCKRLLLVNVIFGCDNYSSKK